MSRRSKMSRSYSRRSFSRAAGMHPKNSLSGLTMRGGIRL